MSSAARVGRQATSADLAALPSDARSEVIGGAIVEKASPSYEHGDTQGALAVQIRVPFHRRSGGGGPGGWWIVTEVEVELEMHEVYRPDVTGWRRDRVPERPTGRPVRIRPDWICEVLSSSNASTDLVTKFRVYHRNGVPHYWIADPDRRVLTVYRWTAQHYVVALQAASEERVRAEPFDAIELHVGSLFGEEVEALEDTSPRQ